MAQNTKSLDDYNNVGKSGHLARQMQYCEQRNKNTRILSRLAATSGLAGFLLAVIATSTGDFRTNAERNNDQDALKEVASNKQIATMAGGAAMLLVTSAMLLAARNKLK